MSKAKVTVLGAGVLGLTCAIRLQESGYSVTVFARDMPEDLQSQAFASPWAGANWASFADKQNKRLQEWEKYTFTKLRELKSPLVMDCPGVNYYANKKAVDETVWFDDFLPNYKVIPKSDLPKDMGYGISFTTLTMDAPAYLQYLAERLRQSGVSIVRRSIPSIEHAYSAIEGTQMVVNCTGLGAKSLLGVEDTAVEPIRGQTILVKAPKVKATISKLDEKPSASYIIPRPNGNVIIGGCFQVGNWDLSVDYDLAEQILKKCYALDPNLSDGQGPDAIEIISHNVGLRPSRRGGPRLEKEIVELPLQRHLTPHLAKTDSVKAAIVHCYGIGPAGYQSSWGMAEDTLNLVKDHFNKSSREARL